YQILPTPPASTTFPYTTLFRSRANDYYRRAVEEVELTDDVPQKEVEERVAGGSNDAEAASILAAIRTLPETYRETLLLRLVEGIDRKSTRLNSSHEWISYAVFF